MGSSATFALAVISLCVVVLGVAYIQITWRRSGASLRIERRWASIRRRTPRHDGNEAAIDVVEIDFERSDVDEPPALVDAAV